VDTIGTKEVKELKSKGAATYAFAMKKKGYFSFGPN